MRGRLRERPLLNPDYRDMLSAFTAENVKYLLVGAYALAAHGHVYTADLASSPGMISFP